ncbi:MAG: hypothetical protein WCK42_08190, partial [Myxococcaceae bacterium]
AILDESSMRMLQPYFCGTKLEDGKYHSASGCSIATGVDSREYCQDGVAWPKRAPKKVEVLPTHTPRPIPDLTPEPTDVPVATGSCELIANTCEQHSRDLFGSIIYFTAESDCLSIKVNKKSACFYTKELNTYHVCKPIVTTQNPCSKASAGECGIREYSLCHLK